MGCFNLSCALSNLSIGYGDRCYFLPLIPTHYTKDSLVHFGQETQICSNDGSMALFQPALYPFLGEYNDYGELENIVEDKNTEVIERVTGKPIKDFISSFHENAPEIKRNVFIYAPPKESKFEDVMIKMSGCFIHEFAYKAMIRYMLSSEFSLINCFPVGNYLIEYCGFVLFAEDETIDKRYKFLYKMEGIEDHAIQSDGEYAHISQRINGKWEQQSLIYNLLFLRREWKKLTGKTINIPKEARQRFFYEIEYDKMASYFEERKKNPELLKWLINSIVRDHNQHILSYEQEVSQKDPVIKKAYCETMALVSYFFLNNKLIMPSLIGPQCGYREAEKSLLSASLKFVESKIKKGRN